MLPLRAPGEDDEDGEAWALIAALLQQRLREYASSLADDYSWLASGGADGEADVLAANCRLVALGEKEVIAAILCAIGEGEEED